MTKPGDKSDERTAKNEPRRDIDALFRDGVEIDRAMRKASRDAIRMHKLLGHSIAVWLDEKVVWIPPEEIDVDGDGLDGETSAPH
jgi:hypothetical protein